MLGVKLNLKKKQKTKNSKAEKQIFKIPLFGTGTQKIHGWSVVSLGVSVRAVRTIIL